MGSTVLGTRIWRHVMSVFETIFGFGGVLYGCVVLGGATLQRLCCCAYGDRTVVEPVLIVGNKHIFNKIN